MVLFAPTALVFPVVAITSIAFLALLGAVGARVGGARPVKAVLRVTFWGVLAMGLTAAIGQMVGMAI